MTRRGLTATALTALSITAWATAATLATQLHHGWAALATATAALLAVLATATITFRPPHRRHP